MEYRLNLRFKALFWGSGRCRYKKHGDNGRNTAFLCKLTYCVACFDGVFGSNLNINQSNRLKLIIIKQPLIA